MVGGDFLPVVSVLVEGDGDSLKLIPLPKLLRTVDGGAEDDLGEEEERNNESFEVEQHRGRCGYPCLGPSLYTKKVCRGYLD